MTRVLGAVLFFFAAAFAIAAGILATFAVDAFAGGPWRPFAHVTPPGLVAVGAGSAVAILGIAAATIGVCRVSGVPVPNVRVHVEQSSLLYIAAAATLVAHLVGGESKAAGAWAPFGVMALTAALMNASALYGIALVRRQKHPDFSLP
jgi:hypothetical protein